MFWLDVCDEMSKSALLTYDEYNGKYLCLSLDTVL